MYSETSVTFYEHPVVQCTSQQQSQLQAHIFILQSVQCRWRLKISNELINPIESWQEEYLGMC